MIVAMHSTLSSLEDGDSTKPSDFYEVQGFRKEREKSPKQSNQSSAHKRTSSSVKKDQIESVRKMKELALQKKAEGGSSANIPVQNSYKKQNTNPKIGSVQHSVSQPQIQKLKSGVNQSAPGHHVSQSVNVEVKVPTNAPKKPALVIKTSESEIKKIENVVVSKMA